ncbi:MAG TPA: type II secretion system protein [Candidatus Omnitrophica bacterium]|nr:type II secretion system protein [Candidatus Omnitrophota bacterium]
MYSRGFHLIEMVIVVIILGVLVGIAMPSYLRSQERTYTREAVVGLRLLRAAQMVYQSEFGNFYPGAGGEGNVADINTNLRLNLSENNWDYNITASAANSFTAVAGRQAGAFDACVYTVSDAIADPTPNASCP